MIGRAYVRPPTSANHRNGGPTNFLLADGPTIVKTNHDLPLLLRASEVARLLSIGRSKAYELIASKQIPGVVRIGRSVRVSSRALIRWIEEIESRSTNRPS